jgi:hypothetical protein
VNQSDMDPQRLAALLENRLDAGERAELMARLAGSDDDFEVFAEAAASLAELREGEVPAEEPEVVTAPASVPGAIPLRPRAPVWRRPVVGMALAAGLAGAVLAPLALGRGGPAGAGEVSALLAAPAAGIPREWDAHPWGATRGTADAMTPEGRGARIGARMVDLESAVRAGNDAQARSIGAELEPLLADVPAGGAAIATVRRAAAGAGTDVATREGLLREAQRTALLAGERPVTRGAWAEAARLAAARRDAEFFRARGSRRLLAGVAKDTEVASAGRQAAERMLAAGRGEALDWTGLQRDARELLIALAG